MCPWAPDAVVEFVAKREDPRDYRVSFEKIKAQLGFTTTRSIADGIAEIARLLECNMINDFTNPEFSNSR